MALALLASAPVDDVEARLAALLSAERLGAFHERLTREPHVAGTPQGRAVAAEIERTLAGLGLASEVREYQAYLSYPKRLAVRLTQPEVRDLPVAEPSDPRDPDTANPALTPGFVAYSASARVEGPVVYVNYGLPADYDALETQGISVKGAVALARYGKVHRAVKVHTAETRGARGLLVYSDPRDDGAAKGAVWPDGPWRAPAFLQRGNAKYSWFWHGDPLTPGVAATEDATRLDPKSAPTLPKIPAAVLSWAAAEPILKHLARGVGPGPAVVDLDVAMTAGLRPIYDVLGRIEGKEEPDREVILGTHHDAWTFGGVDPGSSAAAVLELARALSELRKTGWQPRRSIVFAFWDAEEYGLVGSTEYAEDRAAELRERAVAYVNTDYYLAGPLKAGGSASLRDLVASVAGGPVDLKPLGSGADFVPFQDYLGLPALSLEYGSDASYGSYHSAYDTRRWMASHGDPGWKTGVTLADTLGRTVLRLAQAEILPLRLSRTAEALSGYLDRLAPDPSLAVTRGKVAALAGAARTFESRVTAGLPAATRRAINDHLQRAETGFAVPDGASWYRHVVYGWDIYSLYSGDTLPALRKARGADFVRERLRLEAAIDGATRELQAATALLSPVAEFCKDAPAAAGLAELPSPDDWFRVYRVADGVFEILEPYQFQEVISYLVVGATGALLFDSGMGLGPIRKVVESLTTLPVRVVNSHTHFDHVGGNADFDHVLALDTPFTRASALGMAHDVVKGEVAPGALCRPLPAGQDPALYRIRPWTITGWVKDGDVVDLGGRRLEILSVPGHTPDALALFDREAGLLFTGDTFYDGPLWLFEPETDLDAYERSLARLRALPGVRQLLTNHEKALAPPERLVAVQAAVRAVRAGGVPFRRTPEGRAEYTSGGVTLLLAAPKH